MVVRIRSGSNPRPDVELAWGSRSTNSTECPSSARAAPRLIAVVVLPTPPFWLTIARTVALAPPKSLGSAFEDNPISGAIPRIVAKKAVAANPTYYRPTTSSHRRRLCRIRTRPLGPSLSRCGPSPASHHTAQVRSSISTAQPSLLRTGPSRIGNCFEASPPQRPHRERSRDDQSDLRGDGEGHHIAADADADEQGVGRMTHGRGGRVRGFTNQP